MSTRRTPKLPIPSPLRGLEKDTWANYSITIRLPEIGQRVLNENSYNSEVTENIYSLLNEIPNAPVRKILDPGAFDYAAWDTYCSPYLDMNWLETPWFFTENYFYRRILEATGYFQDGPYHLVDPYHYQKQQGLVTSLKEIQALGLLLEDIHYKYKNGDSSSIHLALKQLLSICLWGNSLDLSLWPVKNNKETGDIHPRPRFNQNANILVDDSDSLIDFLVNRDIPLQRIDVILDNAGYELVCDFALIDILLKFNLGGKIYLHPKKHPTFVSDTIRGDIDHTINTFEQSTCLPVKALGTRLQEYLHTQKLVIREEDYWTSPLNGWDMPEALYQGLSQSCLIISKGDALYRRWHGDCHWPYTTPFSDVIAYLPAPFLALRTLKANVVSGLDDRQITEQNNKDPKWMINGQWGVVQFHSGK